MNTCSTCQHWTAISGNYGTCDHPSIANCNDIRVDAHDPHDGLEFHRNFGCLHFAQKRPESDPNPSQPLCPTQHIQMPPEAQERKRTGFPEPTKEEVGRFWGWMNDRLENGKCLCDELPHVGAGADSIPPKWLVERWRRETEQ